MSSTGDSTSESITASYNEIITIPLHSTVHFPDNALTLKLEGFSHRHARTGGPTNAMATLKVNDKDFFRLSIHGHTTNSEITLDKNIEFANHIFDLMEFSYGKSIQITVKPKK